MPIGKLEREKIQGGRVPGGGLVAYIFPKCCTTKCGATAVRQPESRQLQPASGYCVSDVPPIGIGDKHYWAFYNASDGEYVIGQGGGAAEQHANCVDIEWGEVQPGTCCFIRRMNTSASPQAATGWVACWWCIAPPAQVVWRSPTEPASRQPRGRCGMGRNRGQRNFLCPLFFMFRISDLSASCQGS